jgi:hypothetical protein
MAMVPPGLHTRSSWRATTFRARGRHRSDQARDDIEAGILKGQVFGVSFQKAGVEAFRPGACLRPLHGVRSDIDARDVRSVACRAQSELPRAAGHIQQLASGGNI